MRRAEGRLDLHRLARERAAALGLIVTDWTVTEPFGLIGSDVAAELRREGVRQQSRADQASRDLQSLRRDLTSEQAAHRATQERLATLEATHRSAAADLLAEKAAHEACKDRLRGAQAEYAALQQRVTADQTQALEASQRADTLAKEAGVLADRLTLIKRQLQDEVNAHALTRKQPPSPAS